MNKKHLDNFQLILEERKLIILKQLDDNILDVVGLHNSAPSDNVDFSTINTSSQIEQTIGENLRQELKEIELSLVKIKQNNFGICELCNDDIDIERLKVKPHARYCINCREVVEKEKK